MNRLIWKDVITIFNKTPTGYIKSVLHNVYCEEHQIAWNDTRSTDTRLNDKCIIKYAYVKADGGKRYISPNEWKSMPDERDFSKFWTVINNESYVIYGKTDVDELEPLRNQNRLKKVAAVTHNTHGTAIMRGIVLELER